MFVPHSALPLTLPSVLLIDFQHCLGCCIVPGESLQSLPPSSHCLSGDEGLLWWWRGKMTVVPGVQQAKEPPEPICKLPGPLAFHPGCP